MQEQLSLFGGGPLRIVSWISILQDCTSSQPAKGKKPSFLSSNKNAEQFILLHISGKFYLKKLFVLFIPDEDKGANSNWFTIEQPWP